MALPDNQPLSHPIFTAGDFCASNCESIVFCSDLGFFDVFSKRPERLERLSRAFNDGLAQVEIFHDAHLVGRTDFLA